MNHTRLRIGCAIATVVFLGGPFLWIALSETESGDEASAPPPDTPQGIEDLLTSKGKPEEALQACRDLEAKSGDTPKLAELRMKCLHQLIYKRKDERRWEECAAIYSEAQAGAEANPGTFDQIQRVWHSALVTWGAEAKDDPAACAKVAAHLRAHPDWRATSNDDPVFVHLARAWRERFEAGDFEGADACFEGLLDAVQGPLRAWQERVQFATRACLASENETQAARWFDDAAKHARDGHQPLPLKELAPFFEARLEGNLKRGELDSAVAFFDRLDRIASGSEKELLGRLFRSIRDARWRHLAAASDWDGVRKLFEERNSPHIDQTEDQKDEAEGLLMKWKAAATKEEKSAALSEVVSRLAHAVEPATLKEALAAEWPPEERLKRGDEFAKKGFNGAALACFETLPNSPELDARIDRCRLAIARRSAEWARRIVSWEAFATAEETYADLIWRRPSFAGQRRAAAEELLALQLDWARLYGENEMFPKADAKLRDASRRTAVALWEEDVRAGELWTGVPSALKARVERLHAERTAQVEALRKAAGNGEWFVPQAAPVSVMAAKVRERSAVAQAERARMDLQLPSRRQEALGALRVVLRLYRGTKAAEDARDTIEMEIREAQGIVAGAAQSGGLADRHAVEAFTWLCDLLGFHVAEVGPLPAGDPFREFLKTSLSEAAELARGAPMSRVFLLSLLADALPDDAAGQAAAKEALEAGREIVNSMPPKPPDVQEREAASGLKGFSAQAVENRTPYHLLVFNFGPEEFFFRLNPFSRGSAVFRNGDYDLAVIVTREGVVPYRGKRSCADVTRSVAYVIERLGGETPEEEQTVQDITGGFRLLRAPKDAGLELDPDSGTLRPK